MLFDLHMCNGYAGPAQDLRDPGSKGNSNPDSLFRNFKGARQGPRGEITMAQLAVGYLCLRQPEKQKDSPEWGCSRFYTACT